MFDYKDQAENCHFNQVTPRRFHAQMLFRKGISINHIDSVLEFETLLPFLWTISMHNKPFLYRACTIAGTILMLTQSAFFSNGIVKPLRTHQLPPNSTAYKNRISSPSLRPSSSWSKSISFVPFAKWY